MKRKLILWLVALASFSICHSKEVYYEFNINYFEGAPDGVTVNILGINNQFPGPTIRATKHDVLTIKVNNQIQDHQSTTIHWHGLEQYLTPFMDGPHMITQCDILFNSSFIYQFQLNQAGTYWYHSHHTLQASEGVWGAFIIDNVLEVYNYDGEFLIAATPWYHISGQEQYEWYKDMNKSNGHLPVPDSNLINGFGYYPCEYAQKRNLSCEPTNNRYVMFEVERGKTYRFRYLNSSPVSGYFLTIDEHKFTVIETDGVDTVMGSPVDIIGVSTGGRCSALVTMNGDKDQYWMRFPCTQDSIKESDFPNINPFPEVYFRCTHMLAVLKYITPANTTNVTKKSRMNPEAVQGRPEIHDRELLLDMKRNGRGKLNFDLLNKVKEPVDYNLAAFDDIMKTKFAYDPFPTTVEISNPIKFAYDNAWPIGYERAPNYVNQTIVINIMDPDDPNSPNHRGSFNNITYDTSTLDKPALLKVLLGENLPKSLYPIKINGFGPDFVVEVIFSDFGNTGHPLHLHGHTFWVVGRGVRKEGPFIEEVHRPSLKPVARRDTLSVLSRSWLVIRFRADNPGVWLMHCHIGHHLEIGMALVFEEGLEVAKEIYKIPQQTVDICKRNGIDLDVAVTNASTTILIANVLVAVVLLFNTRML